MALRKTLAYRLFHMAKISSRNPASSDSCGNTFFRRFLNPPPESEESGFLRRWLQRRGVFSSAVRPECLSLPIGDKLIERLRGLNGERLSLEGFLLPPPQAPAPSLGKDSRISVEDARKVLRVTQIEAVKASLSALTESCVSYEEFLQLVAVSSDSSDPSEVRNLARILDESGSVIVLGNVVFLRPEQVVRAIESAIPPSLGVEPEACDPRRKELEEMEKVKKAIDDRAGFRVRRELWCGLGLLFLQTAGFMRLTFWELSWDVMEPICFYVSTVYFMVGYAFFLRTSKEPSFEGLFQSRFSAKQKRLMKAHSFDLERFDELRSIFNHSSSSSSTSNGSRSKFVGTTLHH